MTWGLSWHKSALLNLLSPAVWTLLSEEGGALCHPGVICHEVLVGWSCLLRSIWAGFFSQCAISHRNCVITKGSTAVGYNWESIRGLPSEEYLVSVVIHADRDGSLTAIVHCPCLCPVSYMAGTHIRHLKPFLYFVVGLPLIFYSALMTFAKQGHNFEMWLI
jgi:hypothetical protein